MIISEIKTKNTQANNRNKSKTSNLITNKYINVYLYVLFKFNYSYTAENFLNFLSLKKEIRV